MQKTVNPSSDGSYSGIGVRVTVMKHMPSSAQKLKNALCDAAAVCVKLEAMLKITAIYL
jgi:hypothetical protein